MSRKKSGRLVGRSPIAGSSRKSVGSPGVTAEKRLRLAVAAQPPLFREVLTGQLNRERNLQVVAQASDEEEIVRILSKEKPQVLLFDYEALGPNAESVISRMHRMAPSTRILVLATRSSQETVERVLRVGAAGLVGKQLEFATLVRAIHVVANGELWANRRATAHFVEQLTDTSSRVAAMNGQLTNREWEVVDGVGRGLRNKEIAHRLDISEKTVKSHLNNVFRKLQVDNRFAAGMYALMRDLPKA